MSGRGLVLALASLIGAATPAAAVVLGGGPAATDCWVTFEGITAAGGHVVQCADGDACDADGAVDGRCTFAVTVCVGQTAEGCSSNGITVSALKGAKRYLPDRPALPASAPACGTPNAVVVKLKDHGRRPGKRTLRTLGVTSGKPHKDGDQFTLRCMPPAMPPG
jgi:hypothetical protein